MNEETKASEKKGGGVEDEEDLEKLQAEIARMEAEAARIAKENEAMEKKKTSSGTGAAAGAAGGASSTAGGASAGAGGAKRDGFSIYVGQVDYSSTPEELLAHFEACGTVERVTIVCDKMTGRPKGYAYIEFQAEEAVENAIKLDGSTFKERQLKVTHKRVNEPFHAGYDGGRGGGGPRGGGMGGRGRGGYYAPRGGRGFRGPPPFRGGRGGRFRGRGGYGYHPYY